MDIHTVRKNHTRNYSTLRLEYINLALTPVPGRVVNFQVHTAEIVISLTWPGKK